MPFESTVARRNIAGFERRAVDGPDLVGAAVALIVVDDPEPSFVLTLRAPKLRAHAGQWALPGGKMDRGETPVVTARREVSEEIGIDLSPGAVMGILDDYETRSGYVITPVVFHLGTDFEPVVATDEIAEIYTIPLSSIDVEPTFSRIEQSSRPVIKLPMLGKFIHAPTAAILYQFCQVAIHGQHTRVHEFEQPLFAWK